MWKIVVGVVDAAVGNASEHLCAGDDCLEVVAVEDEEAGLIIVAVGVQQHQLVFRWSCDHSILVNQHRCRCFHYQCVCCSLLVCSSQN